MSSDEEVHYNPGQSNQFDDNHTHLTSGGNGNEFFNKPAEKYLRDLYIKF
jgi:hypothetical protein